MSISEQIERIKNNIASAYSGLSAKGAVLPDVRNSANLRTVIDSIDTSGGSSESVTFSQMNPTASAYMEEVDYSHSSASDSDIASYADQTTTYNRDKGFGTVLDIRHSGTLILIDGYTGITTSQTVTAGSMSVYNLTPGVCSIYAVLNNDHVIQSGTLCPTGTLRMLHPTYMGNVRDLGGWSCDGGTVKYGKLFRGSAVPNRAADIAMLHDTLGIRSELDLRWDSEIEAAMEAYHMTEYVTLIGDDVELTHVDGVWYGISDEEKLKGMLECVFDAVERGRPLYFHCVSGADRTGTLAMILEALLGMSRSDIDKDYELTCFYTGADTDGHARRRNESEWIGLVSAFDSYNGTALRDRVVNWAEKIGIPIDKINAFRTAMIDGIPQTLASTVGTATITQSLTDVISDHTDRPTQMYQPLKIKLIAESDKLISQVRVTMDGADITSKVFKGTKKTLYHSVTLQLQNCFSDNTRKAVIKGECFYCRLRADLGYTLENAAIQVTMGGIDVSNYYSDGMIAIPKVTGNIVVTAQAVPTVLPYTNQILKSVTEIGGSTIYNDGLGYKDGYRYNSSYAEMTEKATAPSFTTGFIQLKPGDVVRIYGEAFCGTDGGMNTVIYDNNGDRITAFTPAAVNTAATGFTAYCSPYVYDSTNAVLSQFTWSHNADGWIKFTLSGRFDPETSIITINEEI